VNNPDYWAIRRYRAEAPIDPFKFPLTTDRDSWIASRLSHCDGILEIGAGDRSFLHKLERLGWSGVYRTMDVGTVACDFHSLNEVNGQFDAAIMREVVEHLPRETLYEYLECIGDRILGPGGRACADNAESVVALVGVDERFSTNFSLAAA
jgi:hypothetical protein